MTATLKGVHLNRTIVILTPKISGHFQPDCSLQSQHHEVPNCLLALCDTLIRMFLSGRLEYINRRNQGRRVTLIPLAQNVLIKMDWVSVFKRALAFQETVYIRDLVSKCTFSVRVWFTPSARRTQGALLIGTPQYGGSKLQRQILRGYMGMVC